MSEIEWVSEGHRYELVEQEHPRILGRNLLSAAHLFASATAMFFLAFFFAYFYLRTLNSNGLWHPKHVDPSLTLGTLSTAAWVAGAIVLWLAVRDRRADRLRQWRVKGAVALALGLAGVVLQIVEWLVAGFGPADGGYASVYFGWTAFIVLFGVGALFWLETTLATSFRYRNTASAAPPAGHGSGDPYRAEHDIADPLSLVPAMLEAVGFYWAYFAALVVIAWIVLYLV
ncbi:MAG TPA: cytochrome c oxidase subunit 3 [Gaiellaceae bacterium]|nr:cytochrome c oxidase subunit 3 [Gaiellaceae bacterium]